MAGLGVLITTEVAPRMAKAAFAEEARPGLFAAIRVFTDSRFLLL
jgi:hypothetical protein